VPFEAVQFNTTDVKEEATAVNALGAEGAARDVFTERGELAGELPAGLVATTS
jgi:hypothetical protein